MYAAMLVVHVFICIALVISVLLQSSKGEGLAGAFGGSSLTGTVFGGRGAATFLSKATTILAITFMASCIVLTFLHPSAGTASTAVGAGSSAVEEAVREGAVPAPAPATTQPAGGTTGQPPVSPDEELFQGGQQAQPSGEGQQTAPAEGQGEAQPQTPPETKPEGSGGD